MSNATHAQPPYPNQQAAGLPASPGIAPTFLFVLCGIGVLSMLIDYVAAGVVADNVAGQFADRTGEVIGRDWLNRGTMYGTLVFALILGVLGLLVRKGSNGARITGAILAIIFTLMGLGSIGWTALMSAAANLAAKDAGVASVVPDWYLIGGITIGLSQVVFSILATVKLFGKQAAGFCKAPKA